MEAVSEDLLYFIEAAIDGMVVILTQLGDDLANRAPELHGANSPYVILTHCLGVMNYWGNQVVTGDDVHRDRPAEFEARGAVGELAQRANRAMQELRERLRTHALMSDAAEQHSYGPERPHFQVATAIVHILEELAQHHGQMEITRDILVRDYASVA